MLKRFLVCGFTALPEHADEGLSGVSIALPSFSNHHRCLDVVAQDRLAGVDIAGQHTVGPFAQQLRSLAGLLAPPAAPPRSMEPRVRVIFSAFTPVALAAPVIRPP